MALAYDVELPTALDLGGTLVIDVGRCRQDRSAYSLVTVERDLTDGHVARFLY